MFEYCLQLQKLMIVAVNSILCSEKILLKFVLLLELKVLTAMGHTTVVVIHNGDVVF